MRLLVGRFLDFEIGGGFIELPVKLVFGFAEFIEGLPHSTGQLGKLFRAEEQNHDQKNDKYLGPARHAESKECVHSCN
jgi:hypothetical protein